MNSANVQNGHRAAKQRSQRSIRRGQQTKRNGDGSDQSRNRGDRQTKARIESRTMCECKGQRGIANIVGGQRDGEIAGGRSRGIERDGDFGSTKRGLIGARVSKDRNRHTRIDETPNFRGAFGRKNLGTNVIDVEGSRDRFTCFTRIARHDHGFDLRIDQMLHGSTSTWAKAILKAEHADETRAERDENDGSSERFELRDAVFCGSDRDAIGKEQRATSDAQVLT